MYSAGLFHPFARLSFFFSFLSARMINYADKYVGEKGRRIEAREEGGNFHEVFGLKSGGNQQVAMRR